MSKRRISRLRRAWFKQRRQRPHPEVSTIMSELFNHTRRFNTKHDLELTQIEDETGVSPTMTPKEVKTFGQNNEPRKEAQGRRLVEFAKDRILKLDGSNTMQWWNQFNQLAVLEHTGRRKVCLWAANNVYMFTYEDVLGTKLSLTYNGREEAMFAYQVYKQDKSYIKWIRLVPPSPE